jgi:hypothetical protein
MTDFRWTDDFDWRKFVASGTDDRAKATTPDTTAFIQSSAIAYVIIFWSSAVDMHRKKNNPSSRQAK